jgi:hypothetical protein
LNSSDETRKQPFVLEGTNRFDSAVAKEVDAMAREGLIMAAIEDRQSEQRTTLLHIHEVLEGGLRYYKENCQETPSSPPIGQ